MRIAHSYYKCEKSFQFRNTLDASANNFGESLRVKERLENLHSWTDFEQVFFGMYWVREFHRVLSQVLVKQRRTLSIGSCFGECEAPFIQKGYDVFCSDINTDVIAHMRQHFSAERYLLFDLFAPLQLARNDFQDILITGLDYAFDDARTVEIFQKCRNILSKSSAQGEKRLLFTLRYNDNLATRFVDQCLLPSENACKNFVMKIRGSQTRYLRKVHGFRRSRREIIAFASREGFQLRQVIYGRYGAELERSSIAKVNLLMKITAKVDPLLKLLNNITLFEFVLI